MKEFGTNYELALLVMITSMARMAAVFAVVPFFAQEFLTGVARNAVTVSLAVILWPMVAGVIPTTPMPLLELFILLGKEVILGILIGYVVSLPFWIADSVGFFIDNQKGTTLASVFNPFSGDQTSPTGALMLQVTITLFFTLGGFLLFLGSLYESYFIFPIFTFTPRITPDFPIFFLHFVDHLSRATVLYAAPPILCMFLAEFGLGLMNRFAPQLNVFNLSLGVKAGVASFILVIYMVFLFEYLKGSILDGQKMLQLFNKLIGG